MCDSLWKLATLIKIRIAAKNNTLHISQWLRQYVEFNTKKKKEQKQKKMVTKIEKRCTN